MKLTVIVGLVLVLLCVADAQRQRGRGRGRGNRRGDQCHLKEIDTCLEKVQNLGKGPDPTAIITTSEGLDRICNAANDVMKCFKGFMKKCGTPLQRELFDFGTEYFVRTIQQFCDPGPLRENFLKNSPCIHDNVLVSSDYKSKCNNNYLAALDHVVNVTSADDRLDMMCCAHNTWEDCSDNLIVKSCGADGEKAFKDFLEKAFGGLTTMVCPRNIFPPNGQTCKRILPKNLGKAKGKFGDNPITRYVSAYFSFLFAASS